MKIFDKCSEMLHARRHKYSTAPDNMYASIAEWWSAYVNTTLSSELKIDLDGNDVLHMLSMMKSVRRQFGTDEMVEDSFADELNYIALQHPSVKQELEEKHDPKQKGNN